MRDRIFSGLRGLREVFRDYILGQFWRGWKVESASHGQPLAGDLHCAPVRACATAPRSSACQDVRLDAPGFLVNDRTQMQVALADAEGVFGRVSWMCRRQSRTGSCSLLLVHSRYSPWDCRAQVGGASLRMICDPMARRVIRVAPHGDGGQPLGSGITPELAADSTPGCFDRCRALAQARGGAMSLVNKRTRFCSGMVASFLRSSLRHIRERSSKLLANCSR